MASITSVSSFKELVQLKDQNKGSNQAVGEAENVALGVLEKQRTSIQESLEDLQQQLHCELRDRICTPFGLPEVKVLKSRSFLEDIEEDDDLKLIVAEKIGFQQDVVSANFMLLSSQLECLKKGSLKEFGDLQHEIDSHVSEWHLGIEHLKISIDAKYALNLGDGFLSHIDKIIPANASPKFLNPWNLKKYIIRDFSSLFFKVLLDSKMCPSIEREEDGFNINFGNKTSEIIVANLLENVPLIGIFGRDVKLLSIDHLKFSMTYQNGGLFSNPEFNIIFPNPITLQIGTESLNQWTNIKLQGVAFYVDKMANMCIRPDFKSMPNLLSVPMGPSISKAEWTRRINQPESLFYLHSDNSIEALRKRFNGTWIGPNLSVLLFNYVSATAAASIKS